jgi:putrescine transport system ATP-binding protein
MEKLLIIKSLSKKFGVENVLHELDLSLAEGQVLSILGRSGSGKTTLLKIIAGLETLEQGQIFLNQELLNTWPPQRRNILYLYQEALLFPHLNVVENIAFGLRLRRMPSAEIEQKTAQMLEELGLSEQAQKMPDELSGGQRQRVAFGRALIVNPRVLLLDEPFGALDAQTRQQMQVLFKRLAQAHRITAIFVTHDLKEALLMGDEMATLDHGQLTVYPTKTAFIEDAATGVQAELAFWKNLVITDPTAH